MHFTTHLTLLSTLLAPIKRYGKKYREVKEPAQGDRVTKWHSQNLNQSHVVFMLLTTILYNSKNKT
jgi:hypothetical protein